MRTSFDWKYIRNVERDDTCLILGNGPSLKLIPRDLLSKYPVFGTNRIFLRTDITLDYYVCVNPLVICQNKDKIRSLEAFAKFIEFPYNLLFEGVENMLPVHSILPIPSTNAETGVCQGSTVTNVCLQIAYYMNFKTVLLFGVDHKYADIGVSPNQVVIQEGEDTNHFHPGYFCNGTMWQYPDLPSSEIYYSMVNDMFLNHNRRIVNLTPDTALDIFEKQSASKWI